MDPHQREPVRRHANRDQVRHQLQRVLRAVRQDGRLLAVRSHERQLAGAAGGWPRLQPRAAVRPPVQHDSAVDAWQGLL